MRSITFALAFAAGVTSGCQTRETPDTEAPGGTRAAEPQGPYQVPGRSMDSPPAQDQGAERTGEVTLEGTGEREVGGELTLVERDGKLRLQGTVSGLTPNSTHAIHIHQKGDCGNKGEAAGPHFNPVGTPHGAPGPNSHVGDLGNLKADGEGVAKIDKEVAEGTLGGGPTSVANRALIVHAGEDDLKSQPSGDAGGRIACGVIKPG